MNESTSHSHPSSNNELRQFLTRFSAGPVAPYYAVMLNGAWGSGKTWFIKNFIETLDANVRERVLYVSLYGVSKPSDIEDAFFQQLYPKLSNKKLQYGYSIFKGFLKGTLKIDLDGDGKDDASAQISLPELERFTSDPQRTLLVFDDLERAKLSPEELLGYINQFVEHEGRRVIIVANENNLLESTPQFRDIKEKVIGRTFEITPEPAAAIANFIREMLDCNVEPILAARKSIILEVFQRADHKNLRNLRQALLDFANLWECLPVEEKKLRHHEEFKDRLLEEVLALSIEYRTGTLSLNDIEGLEISPRAADETAQTFGKAEQTANAADVLAVHGLSPSRAVLLPSVYEHFFRRGYLPKELAREGLKRGAFFTDDAKPAWQQLWHRLELTNARFDLLRLRLLEEFASGAYRKPEEFLHAFGILLQLEKEGLLDRSSAELAELGRKTVAGLKDQGGLEVDTQAYKGRFSPNTSEGFGMRYQGRENAEFREFAESIGNEWSRRIAEAMQTRVADWLKELKTDHKTWARRISDGEKEVSWFNEQPIFAFVDPQEFFDILLSLEPAALTSMVPVLRRRYANTTSDLLWLTDEVPFWKRLDKLLFDLLADDPTSTLSVFVVKEQICPLVEDIADRWGDYLDEFKKRERALFGDRDQ